MFNVTITMKFDSLYLSLLSECAPTNDQDSILITEGVIDSLFTGVGRIGGVLKDIYDLFKSFSNLSLPTKALDLIKKLISTIAKDSVLMAKAKAIIETVKEMYANDELVLQEGKFDSRFDGRDLYDITKLFFMIFLIAALFYGAVHSSIQTDYRLNMGKDDFETVCTYFNISLDSDNMSVGAVKEPFLSLTPSQQRQLQEILKKAKDNVNKRLEVEQIKMGRGHKQNPQLMNSLKADSDILGTLQGAVDSVQM
jgi:hypothetical protein